VTFQGLILKLSEFWASRGCTLQQPLDIEVGAGTMHPETFLRVLGPAHWNVAYVQPSRRPADGRFGENPNRLFKHHQFQVILKPSPDEVQQLYLESLEACGINPRQHDIRFEEDNWESPTLGAWGIGWQILFDGLEITQFILSAGRWRRAGADIPELTYGLERIAMPVLQRVERVRPRVVVRVKYRDVRFRDEVEQSVNRLQQRHRPAARRVRRVPPQVVRRLLPVFRSSCDRASSGRRSSTASKCSHLFNVLDASNSIGVAERTSFILRVRQLAVGIAKAYVEETAAGNGTRLPEAAGEQET
jgi:glycyl-tRNA synthetase alpha chain